MQKYLRLYRGVGAAELEKCKQVLPLESGEYGVSFWSLELGMARRYARVAADERRAGVIYIDVPIDVELSQKIGFTLTKDRNWKEYEGKDYTHKGPVIGAKVLEEYTEKEHFASNYEVGTLGDSGTKIHLIHRVFGCLCNQKNLNVHMYGGSWDMLTCEKCRKEAQKLGLIRLR